MTSDATSPSSGPTSSGTEVLAKPAFEEFLENSVQQAVDGETLGALVLVRISQPGGQPLTADSMESASSALAQLGRQADVMSVVGPGTLAMVLTRLASRQDVHVMLGRIQDFFETSMAPWTISTGVGVFPLCGTEHGRAWEAACRDLEGALSSSTWVHEIPRETLRTRRTG